MDTGFTYIKNSFYIEDDGGHLLSDPIRFNYLLKNHQFNCPDDYNQAIALNHELNHYVQEISIGACITEGFFIDYLAGYTIKISHIENVKFPLADINNREYNLKLPLSRDEKDTLNYFYEIYDVYCFIFEQDHNKPKTSEYAYSETADSYLNNYSISFKDIIEFYAFHKSYWDFFIAAKEDESARVLHSVVKENFVYPITFQKDSYIVENLKRNIIWNKPYQVLNLLFFVGLPFWKSHKEYLNYCEKDIPLNYLSSPSANINSAQKVIIEAALHIPSIDFIMSNITKGKYSIEVFSPVHRFYRILKCIREYGGYPDAKKGEDFFITFIDWIAGINDWPSYKETLESLAIMLYRRGSEGKEAITNHQMVALYYKNQNFGVFAQDFPINIFLHLNLPLVIRSNGKLQIIQFLMDNSILNFPNNSDFYDFMFRHSYPKYKPIITGMDAPEMINTVFNNGQASIIEILNRLQSRAAFDAYIKKGYFCCPFHQNGCPNRSLKCGNFIAFEEAIVNCKKRITRFGEMKSFNQYGGGNVEDCIFLNYLIDYNYNTDKLR